MELWFLKVISILKTPANYFLPVLTASSFGLFAPERLIHYLGIMQWREELKVYLGSAFVISLCVVVFHYSAVFMLFCIKKYRVRLATKAQIACLESLTFQEKEILAGYFYKKTRTQNLWAGNGVVTGLVERGILYPAATEGFFDSYPFNISPWVWEYFNKNPRMVNSHLR